MSELPPNSMSPLVTEYKRLMQLNNVVLPAPLGPMMPRICPLSTSKLTPSNATMPPKVTRTLSHLNNGPLTRSPPTMLNIVCSEEGRRCADGPVQCVNNRDCAGQCKAKLASVGAFGRALTFVQIEGEAIISRAAIS